MIRATPLVVVFLISLSGYSQNVREVTVGPEQTTSEAFALKDKYRFENFQDGYIVTRQRKKSQAMKLNFNYISGLPQFIDPKGDTLFVDEHVADLVYVGRAIFLWNASDKSYYELIMYQGDIKLAVEKTWKIARVETVYNDPLKGKTVNIARDPGSAIYSQKLNRMVRNENTIYRRDSAYVYIDARGDTYKANRSSLLKVFPNQKREIDRHLDATDVNFKDEDQLKMLFQYCISLMAK